MIITVIEEGIKFNKVGIKKKADPSKTSFYDEFNKFPCLKGNEKVFPGPFSSIDFNQGYMGDEYAFLNIYDIDDIEVFVASKWGGDIKETVFQSIFYSMSKPFIEQIMYESEKYGWTLIKNAKEIEDIESEITRRIE